jgi:hypothetical protein
MNPPVAGAGNHLMQVMRAVLAAPTIGTSAVAGSSPGLEA